MISPLKALLQVRGGPLLIKLSSTGDRDRRLLQDAIDDLEFGMSVGETHSTKELIQRVWWRRAKRSSRAKHGESHFITHTRDCGWESHSSGSMNVVCPPAPLFSFPHSSTFQSTSLILFSRSSSRVARPLFVSFTTPRLSKLLIAREERFYAVV